MNSELKVRLAKDLNIKAYSGEFQTYYESRLVYSALSEWMKFAVYDETTDSNNKKSKSYLLKRGCEILNSFICDSESQKQWFTDDAQEKYDFNQAVIETRNRMLASGELLELLPSHDVSVPKQSKIDINDTWSRLIGLRKESDPKNVKAVGITRICIEENTPSYAETINIKEYMNWAFKSANWSNVDDVNKYEFFNPYSRNAPYKSWIDSPVGGIDIHLGRISLFNGVHEYYLIKRNRKGWASAPLTDALTERKEERRMLLGLRLHCGNPAVAEYSDKGNCIELRLYCGLPALEQAYIETYCWPKRYFNDKLNYIIPIEVWPIIKNKLELSLGIKTEELKDG